MSKPDAMTEFLVLLALDNDFRQSYNSSTPEQRLTLLQEKLHNFGQLGDTDRKTLKNRDIVRINEHIFNNTQTSSIAAHSLVKALRSFLATLESEVESEAASRQ